MIKKITLLLLASILMGQPAHQKVGLMNAIYLVANSRVDQVQRWATGGDQDQDLICCVVPSSQAGPSKLMVFRADNTHEPLFSMDVGDSIISMIPSRVNSTRLITIWASGSGIFVRVFNYEKDNIRMVLESGGGAMPEFIFYGDAQEDGEISIIVPKVKWVTKSDMKASTKILSYEDVYVWEKDRYIIRPAKKAKGR